MWYLFCLRSTKRGRWYSLLTVRRFSLADHRNVPGEAGGWGRLLDLKEFSERNMDRMTLSRVIVLAAGQGSRLMPLTADRPKSMLAVNGEPLLLRTLRQLQESGFESITVVVGYRADFIRSALEGCYATVNIVDNPDYERDTNILSLMHGLADSEEPALVLEGDVALDDGCFQELKRVVGEDRSVWFTHGSVRKGQIGGMLKSNAHGQLIDLLYAEHYEDRLSTYKKLLGLLFIGPREMPAFQLMLMRASAVTTRQYYMIPWVQGLPDLPSWEVDLAEFPACTFNTEEDYHQCRAMFG